MLCLKLARKDHTIPLSDVLPVLENMGLRVIQEQPYEFVTARRALLAARLPRPAGRGAGARHRPGRALPGRSRGCGAARSRATASTSWCCTAWTGARSGAARLLQVSAAGRHPVQPGLHGADARPQSGLARQAAQLFEAKFDPDADGERQRGSPSSRRRSAPAWMRSPISTRTASSGATCASSWRRCAPTTTSAGLAARRTAVPVAQDQSGGRAGDAAAAAGLRDLRLSPRTEGVHLRGGKVARGGIRWSDRARTSAPRCSA